jgi:NTE family protein
MPPQTGPLSVARGSDDSGPRIGLCLSGGGFRAAFFGAGVVRYLAEAGQLPQLQAVSAVSGGSITAAILAERWPELSAAGFSPAAFEQAVVGPFAEQVATKNLRNRGIGRWLLTRPTPRGRYGSARGETLVKHLLAARRVIELPNDLQVILTSTDLASGRAFRVSQEFVGGWQFGYAKPCEQLGLATALAASTAVPLLFPPVHLKTGPLGLPAPETPAELSLVDGGVYDNLGLEWFQGWDRGRPDAARPCDFVIVVDASGPLSVAPRRFGWARSVGRSQAAQYMQSRASRIRWFVDQLKAGTIRGIYIPITAEPGSFQPPRGAPTDPGAAAGALPEGFAAALATLRTDLDRFKPEEVALLMYHGYWAAHVRLHHLRPDMAAGQPAWRDYEHLDPAEEARLREIVSAGVKRRLHR